MGLDMYLYRMPRYGSTTPHEIDVITEYFDWKEQPDAKKYTMEEWCGIPFKDVPSKEVRDFYAQYYVTKYAKWDDKHQFPRKRIKEEIGYWRKANQIHNWFVGHVQDGEDDCRYHHEVTKEILEELLDTCKTVLASCELVPAKIKNGYTCNKNGDRIYNYLDGLIVKDSNVADELLPSCEGFFFGGTDYDEYYVNDIKDTIDIITMALEATDFETQMIYYVSSW